MEKLRTTRRPCIVIALFVATAIASSGQTFKTLASFDGTDGGGPFYVTLVQGANGDFFGTTSGDGANNAGTVFEVSPAGKITTLYNFCSLAECTDGYQPYAGVALATNGNFYGTTVSGGSTGYGNVFEITPAGKLTTIYSFCYTSSTCDSPGYNPHAGVTQGSNGNFYGTTFQGTSNDTYNDGAIYEISGAGTIEAVFNFDIYAGDGGAPSGPLVQASNGDFYGTTEGGGTNFYGAVFKMNSAVDATTIYSFCSLSNCSDGENPIGGVVLASNGDFYGTTAYGGANGDGTVFKITPAGTLITLYSFCSQALCADGGIPQAGLVQATDGNFYGVTTGFGSNGSGTLFRITPSGNLKVLHTFCSEANCADGNSASGAPMQATNGDLYGTTDGGGTSGVGTIYRWSTGLAPFVETIPTSGKVGAMITILGNNLGGATSVTFNGTAASSFTAAADEIKVEVPTGATTGTVQVVTSSGTLNSHVPFRVVP